MFPPPVSELKAIRLFVRSQVASGLEALRRGVVVAGPSLGSWLKSLTEMNAGVREVNLVYNVSGAAV